MACKKTLHHLQFLSPKLEIHSKLEPNLSEERKQTSNLLAEASEIKCTKIPTSDFFCSAPQS